MDISTSRFSIQDHPTMPGHFVVRDRRAGSYYPYCVRRNELPGFTRLAAITEDQFDKIIAECLYGNGGIKEV